MTDKKIERIYEAFSVLNDRITELTPEDPISMIENQYVELYDAITDNQGIVQ